MGTVDGQLPGSAGGGARGGATGAAGAEVKEPGRAAFACNAAAKPPVDRLKKLTGTQYRNTLTDLVTFALGGDAAAAAQVIAEAPALAELPKDARASVAADLHGSFRRLDQTLQQPQVDATYDVGLQIGAALTAGARLGKVVGACATDGNAANDDACVTDFIKRFGARALRRPLGAEEVTFYRGVYAVTKIDAGGFAATIAALLGAPQFFYLVESGGAPVAGKPGVYTLSAYELASRLSYQFWDTMPDEALWRAAADGSLLTDATWAAEVDRLLASPRARQTIAAFYADWLKLGDVKPLDVLKTDPLFKAFAGADLPKPTLHQSMIDEVAGLVDHYTWGTQGTLRDLLTSDLSFARTAEVASLYGVSAWDGKAPPPTLRGSRPGLLTRAAFLASPSGNTRPIMKGVFVRTTILCDEIPPPPADAGVNTPLPTSDLTTRQVVEGLTEGAGSSCASCHATLINALGFATEGYDALGRVRTKQRLYDATGRVKSELPIDTRSVPRVFPDDDRPSSGPADLARLIVDSGKADACFARQYFRFTFARWENDAADGCALEQLRAAARGGSLASVLRTIALSPQFRQRRFE
jgi:hypothetical protein